MTLPMLIGSTDCGPSNPLQSLSKRFDQDRGIHQDFIGTGRNGLSKDIFRTQPEFVSREHFVPFVEADVQSALASKLAADAALYDLSMMRAALPAASVSYVSQQPLPPSSWASDFLQQSVPTVRAPVMNSSAIPEADIFTRHAPNNANHAPNLTHFRLSPLPTYLRGVPQLERPVIDTRNTSWEKEFQVHELQIVSETSSSQTDQTEQAKPESSHDAQELALTAGLLLNNVKNETNPKFQNSQFMELMKQLRDHEVVVDGNKIVENDGGARTVDMKGKARAIPRTPLSMSLSQSRKSPVASLTPEQERSAFQQGLDSGREDPNVAYFQRENEDFIAYWTQKSRLSAPAKKDAAFWDKLQDDWDEFDAAATGISTPQRPYQFLPNNPYLQGYSSRTRHHLMHDSRLSESQSVLELEAAVQRSTTDPNAWYELGVKQQENERENKALQALQQAVRLDPAFLSAWLALAVSHANNNSREGTLEAISSWVKYKIGVDEFNAAYPADPHSSLANRYSKLIKCLISLATSDRSAEVDPDIQIALAVLLNANEEYTKAQDCFQTALAVRPDDWLLYNRVGATMANSGRAGQALEYYYRALELNPGYIRARFNLGISFINLRRYEEAAQHVLDALVLQENDGSGDDIGLNKRGVGSAVLWSTLKTTSLHLQRPDLAVLCDTRDLEGFRNKFI